MATRTCNHRSRRSDRANKAIMRALVSELPDSLRRLRVDTLSDTLANGVPVDPHALTVVLSALDETCAEPLLVTGDDIETLLWVGIEQFCDTSQLATPPGCAHALHAALSLAAASGAFAEGSDSAAELIRPLREMGLV